MKEDKDNMIDILHQAVDHINNIQDRLSNADRLIEFEMEEDATIDDYYDELFNFKKIGVLARTKYKGEYVYSSEYNIRKKLYEIDSINKKVKQLKNNNIK